MQKMILALLSSCYAFVQAFVQTAGIWLVGVGLVLLLELGEGCYAADYPAQQVSSG